MASETKQSPDILMFAHLTDLMRESDRALLTKQSIHGKITNPHYEWPKDIKYTADQLWELYTEIPMKFMVKQLDGRCVVVMKKIIDVHQKAINERIAKASTNK